MHTISTSRIPASYGSSEAQRAADAKGEQIAATREITAAIRALPVWARTPSAYAHIAAILSAEIQRSGWGHTDAGTSAQELLDDFHDVLEYAE